MLVLQEFCHYKFMGNTYQCSSKLYTTFTIHWNEGSEAAGGEGHESNATDEFQVTL